MVYDMKSAEVWQSQAVAVLFSILLHGKCFAASSCLLDRPNFCSCDAFRRRVSCSNVDLPIREVLPYLIPSDTRVLLLRKNWVHENVVLRQEHLQRLKNLEWLDLSKNRITNIEDFTFYNFPLLKRIDINWNRIRILEKDVFAAPLPRLQRLSLTDNKILLILEGTFSQIPSLSELDLQHNPLLHLSPRAFEGLSNLTSLRMSDCNLTNFPEQAFTPLINLRTLELRRWKQLKRLADFSFRSNAKLTSLVIDGFASMSHDGLTSDCFFGLHELRHLTLKGCNLSVVPNRSLRHVPNLRTLDLSDNHFKIIRQDDLIHLSQLESISFANCRLLEIELFVFRKMLGLSELNLSNNRLQTLSRESFPVNLASLAILTLSFNNWICDCRLRWLGKGTFNLGIRSAYCSSPINIQGVDLKEIEQHHSSPNTICFPPKIESFSSFNVTEVPSGTNVNLLCKASGYPQPIITWHTPKGSNTSNCTGSSRRHKIITSKLQIRVVTARDAGDYRCVASNSAGDDTRTIELKVKGDPGDGEKENLVGHDGEKDNLHLTESDNNDIVMCRKANQRFNPIIRLLITGMLGCISIVGFLSSICLAIWGHNNKKAKERLRLKITNLQKQEAQRRPHESISSKQLTYHESKRVTFGQSVSSGYGSGFNSPKANSRVGNHKQPDECLNQEFL